ncbi:unnamed protein product [Gadus morhua 'NCC']
MGVSPHRTDSMAGTPWKSHPIGRTPWEGLERKDSRVKDYMEQAMHEMLEFRLILPDKEPIICWKVSGSVTFSLSIWIGNAK